MGVSTLYRWLGVAKTKFVKVSLPRGVESNNKMSQTKIEVAENREEIRIECGKFKIYASSASSVFDEKRFGVVLGVVLEKVVELC